MVLSPHFGHHKRWRRCRSIHWHCLWHTIYCMYIYHTYHITSGVVNELEFRIYYYYCCCRFFLLNHNNRNQFNCYCIWNIINDRVSECTQKRNEIGERERERENKRKMADINDVKRSFPIEQKCYNSGKIWHESLALILFPMCFQRIKSFYSSNGMRLVDVIFPMYIYIGHIRNIVLG